MCLGVGSPQRAHAEPGDATYAAIALAVKNAFSHTAAGTARSAAELKTLLEEELKWAFQSLGLMNKEGVFLVEALKNKGLRDTFDPAAFVDEVMGCAKQNPYLNAFIDAAGKAARTVTYPNDHDKDPKRKWMVSAVVYMKALDRLGKLVRQDIGVIEAIRNHYRHAWEHDAEFQKAYFAAMSVLRDKSNIFFRIKLASVDPGITDFIEFIKKQSVPPTHGRWLLSLNIAEAAAADFAVGNTDNARAGGILAENRVGSETTDAKTQAGPSVLSADKKAVLYSPPLPKQWADLYHVWNLAFVSQAGSSPFLFAKLLTPQVGCYAAAPKEYLFNRAIALYLHLHFTMYRGVDHHAPKLAEKAGRPVVTAIEWSDEPMTKLWGATNLHSAQSYAQEVECLTPGWLAKAKATFAESVDKASSLMRPATGTPTQGQEDPVAHRTGVIQEIDKKMKEWGAWLDPNGSCKLKK
jgi:hypothetical protein